MLNKVFIYTLFYRSRLRLTLNRIKPLTNNSYSHIMIHITALSNVNKGLINVSLLKSVTNKIRKEGANPFTQ